MFSDSLQYLRESDEWVRTVLIGGVLSLLGVLLVPILPVLGYMVRVLDQTADGNFEAPAFDDWRGLFVDGLKALAVSIAYFLVPAAVAALLVGGGLALAATTGLEAVGAVIALVGWVATIAVGLGVWYVFPAALTRFAQSRSIGDAFEFGEIRSVVTTSTYATGWLYGFVVVLAGSVVVGLLAAVPILGWIAGFFVGFYAQVAAVYCYGRAYGETVGVDPQGGAPVEGEHPVV